MISGYDTAARTHTDGHHSLYVQVQGVHCAGCIRKIEHGLTQCSFVTSARLNFSTQRLHIEWQGDVQDANTLVQIVVNLGYEVQPYTPDEALESEQAHERFLLLCLGAAGFAMGNIMLLSVGVWSTSSETMGEATRDFLHWIAAFIALPTILFSGRPFFRSAIQALRAKQTNMDVPISIALILTGGMSLVETLRHGEHVYFDSAVMLIFFLLIGRVFDFRARKAARSTASSLLSTFAGFTRVLEGGAGKG